jgi:hypothetical protein
VLSFLSANRKTFVKVPSEVATRIRKSFILHGWAGRHHDGTTSKFQARMGLAFVKLENAMVSSRTHSITSGNRGFFRAVAIEGNLSRNLSSAGNKEEEMEWY